MNKLKSGIAKFTKDANILPNYAIIFTTVVLFVYCYFGSYSFFENAFPSASKINFYKYIYHHITAFFLFFLLGVLFTKFIMKQRLKNYGFGAGNHKFGIIFCAVATVIIPFLALSCVYNKDMMTCYPLVNLTELNYTEIFLFFISYFLYYAGWEYLFRGILFFSSEDKFGPITAVLITTMISALIHTSIGGFGKPVTETLSAIPAGILFGYVTYKTRSIWYAVYIHALLGFLIEIFFAVFR